MFALNTVEGYNIMNIDLSITHDSDVDIIAKKCSHSTNEFHDNSILNYIKIDKKYNWSDLDIITIYIGDYYCIELNILALTILCKHEITENNRIMYIDRDIIFRDDKELYTFLSPNHHTAYTVTTKDIYSIPVILGISFYKQPELIPSKLYKTRISQFIRHYYDSKIIDKNVCVMNHTCIYYDGLYIVTDKKLDSVEIKMRDRYAISSNMHTCYEYNKKYLDMCCVDTICDIISIKYNVSNNIKRYLYPNDNIKNEYIYYIKHKSYKIEPICNNGDIVIKFDKNITGTIILSMYNELFYTDKMCGVKYIH